MKRAQVYKFLKSPLFISFCTSLLIFVVTLALTHKARGYTSDDVSWQNILHDWQPFSGKQVTLGASDNFVSKIPFFYVFENLFSAGRKLLFLQSAVLAVLGFTAYYFSVAYFLVKAKVKLTYSNLLPFAWLASFGYSFSQLYLNPIWRGYEMGISFAVFALTAAYFSKAIDPFSSWLAKLATGALVALFGLMIYSDPYFLFFAIGPVAIFSLVLWYFKKISLQQTMAILAISVISIIISRVVHLITVKAGIRMATAFPIEFASFERLFPNVAQSVHSTLILFGADFTGKRQLVYWPLAPFVTWLCLVWQL